MLDDHSKQGIEEFPKEKWPSDIFLRLLWNCLNDLVSIGYLEEKQAHDMILLVRSARFLKGIIAVTICRALI